jgi:hypothetical protein
MGCGDLPDATRCPKAPAALEGDVLGLVGVELARDEGFAAWLYRESLPVGHALLTQAPDARPRVVRVGPGREPHTLDVYLEHPEQGWRLLLIITVRVVDRLTREQHDQTRARARALVEEREASGSLVVVIAPRRYIRDGGHVGRYSRAITMENVGEWLVEQAERRPDLAGERAQWRRRLREGAEEQVRQAAAFAAERAARVWGEYDAVLRAYAAHLRVESRAEQPGGDVVLVLSPGRRVEHLPAVRLRHSMRECRAALDVLGLGESAPAVAARLREDLPMDMFIECGARALVLWLRLPPVEARALASHGNDLRHAFGALWRLKNWYLRHVEEWGRWRGLAGPG